MKFLFGLALVFCFFPLQINASSTFEGVQVTEDEEEMEAHFKNDTLSSEFCCDREYTADWAQQKSKKESQDIVKKVLALVPSEKPKPTRRRLPPAGSGQR